MCHIVYINQPAKNRKASFFLNSEQCTRYEQQNISTNQLWPKRLLNSAATNYIHIYTRSLSTKQHTHKKKHFKEIKNKTFPPGILVLNIQIASDIVKAATNNINKKQQKAQLNGKKIHS